MSASSAKHQSRRSNPRLEVMGQIHGHLVTFNVPLLVKDLSEGGFCIESVVSFPLGVTHLFRFTTEAGDTVVLRAQALHCRKVTPTVGPERFVAGFEFVRRPGEDDGQAIDTLLEAATSVLRFD